MTFATLTKGIDRVAGERDRDNVFLIAPDTLGPDDTITGIHSSLFNDSLVITGPGTITAAQWAGVSGADVLYLSDSGNAVTLTDHLVAGTAKDIFAVIGGAGDDTADARGVTSASRIAFYAGSGSDSFFGGNGNDYFEFAADQLTCADTVAGNDGFDVLALRTGGAVSAAALANVSGIEQIILHDAGNTITLTNASVAGARDGVMAILTALASDDTIDASGITNGVRIAVFTRDGNTTFIGGNGSDYLSFEPGSLTASDHVDGGANYDIIEFSRPGAVGASAFTNVTGIDSLILHHGGSDVTLTNGLVAGSDNGVFVVIDGYGSDKVDASSVVASRVVFAASTGDDSFTGGGGSDVALWSPYHLGATDTFIGGAGFDVLQLTTAGTVGADAFANFSGVDELFLTLGGGIITLSGGVVASSDNGVFVVYDQAGHNTVDASAATLGGRVVFIAVAGDHNTYTGGTGADFFMFGAANLNATDTLKGGAGTDFLVVTTAGSVTAADLANVSEIEVVQLQSGGSIALADTLSNTGRLEADGSAAVDTIDGSAVTSYDLVIRGGGGADTLKGGAGNDRFFLPDTDFASIDGGGGTDTIVLTSAFDGDTFDLSALAAKITGVEAISLEGAAGATITLAPDDIAQINPATNLLYLVGGSDDEFNVGGSGWTQLETNHINLAVSATHSFVHYHNTNGSDLYVDSLFAILIAWDPDLLLA